jgi:hypothetical protein
MPSLSDKPELIKLDSLEAEKILSDMFGRMVTFGADSVKVNKPEYELHFAIKAVVWEDGTVSWEHASEMYESSYPNGTVWDSNKCEWDFYRENNETMESKCHEKLSETLKKMSQL